MSDISELLNVVNDQIESSSSHIKKTKAYKMYIEANKDCHDTSKLHYLQRVVQQIEAGVLDKRHLIATKGSGRTLKSFYADTVLKEGLVSYIRDQLRLAQERLIDETLQKATVPPDNAQPVAAETAPLPDPLVAEMAPPLPDPIAAEMAPLPDPVAADVGPDSDPLPPTVLSTAKDENTDTFKLRFVHREDWINMRAETRDLLDSLDNNKHKGQLLLLDKLPTQQKTSNLFSQSLFITSLARDTTANHKIYGHVASHGTLVMAAHNATDKKLGLFRIEHGDVTSKLCINSATRNDDTSHAIWHCSFPA